MPDLRTCSLLSCLRRAAHVYVRPQDYSFCVYCRRGFHGNRNACALPQSSAIVSAYLEGDEEQKRTLELRYGASNIKRLVAAYEEERALREWLDANATECPGCSCYVNKSSGCNHMTCSKCNCHFCYRCGKVRYPPSLVVLSTSSLSRLRKETLTPARACFRSPSRRRIRTSTSTLPVAGATASCSTLRPAESLGRRSGLALC